MRTALVAFAMVSLVRACGLGPEEGPPVAAAPPAVPPPVAAQGAAPSFAMNAMHGGSVLFVEDQWVEVVPKEDGTIEAYVLDTNGAPPAAPAMTNVAVKVQGDDGAQHDVVLPWNPTTSRFEGRLVEARPAPGPVEVTVGVAGRPPRRARSPRVVVVPAAPQTVVVRPSAPPAVVVVPPAPPGVVVVPPAPPRPVIVVEPQRGPDVVVVEGRHDRGRHRGHHRGDVVVVAPDPRPTVVVAPPRPGAVVVSPGRPGAVVVSPRGPGAVVVTPGRSGGHGDRHERGGERGRGGGRRRH
jgi:hypothetical protein